MMVANGTPLEELKKHLALVSPAIAGAAPLALGRPDVDARLGGGLPRGRIVEIAGDWSSGKTTLLFGAMAQLTARRQLCAYVDGRGELYPPAAAALGVDLERLLVVRPPARGAARAGEIVARSAAFPLVVLDLGEGDRIDEPAAARLRAAVSGTPTVVAALTTRAGAVAQAAVKLHVCGGEVAIHKGGQAVATTVDRSFQRQSMPAEIGPRGLVVRRR
jgi:RecA/RadA recombinase